MEVDKIQPLWRDSQGRDNPHLGWYNLGAILERFPQPSYEFLMIENERSSDSFSCSSTAPPYGITLDVSGEYPPWSGAGSGVFAFRHVLPRDTTLYRSQATANFLFIDTHVEVMTPSADITMDDRDYIRP